MKAEKIILSTVAVIIGLIAAGVAFYLYQMTKVIPPSKEETLSAKIAPTPTPTPNNENFLTLDNPKDELVSENKKINISGKTSPNATIIVSTESNDQIVNPSSNGEFSLNTSLDSGTSLMQILAVFPNGEEKSITRTVTYTDENF